MEHRTIEVQDGLRIAVHDLGGAGEPLLMVHATGFCGAMFEPLAASLGDRFHCWAVDLRGHGDSTRPPDGDFSWDRFAADILFVVHELGLEGAFAFGHSCGATALFLAEEQRPGTFRAFYCYEPALGFSPGATKAQPNVLSQSARRRRAEFESEAALRQYLAGKALFGGWNPACIDAYVSYGFTTQPGGSVRLKCEPDSEAATFENGATHDCLAHLGEITAAVTLVYGDRPDSFGEPMRRAVADRLRDVDYRVLEGLGHLGPMEDPPRLAREIATAFGR